MWHGLDIHAGGDCMRDVRMIQPMCTRVRQTQWAGKFVRGLRLALASQIPLSWCGKAGYRFRPDHQ